jgi:acetylornithine deacetylase/succinyl-diaminopimelate desuccinylase-like protein
MTAVDGYLCGRGTSDNKGPVLAFIYAVKVGAGGVVLVNSGV